MRPGSVHHSIHGRPVITIAGAGDAEAILNLQILAYAKEAALYGDFNIPPMTQTPDEIKAEFKSHLFLKATIGSVVIGSVRAKKEGDTCYIGRLIVHPDAQDRGIGGALMQEVESCFPSAARFELFTGHRSRKSIRLYEKLGYRSFKRERVSDSLVLVYMEKAGPGGEENERGAGRTGEGGRHGG